MLTANDIIESLIDFTHDNFKMGHTRIPRTGNGLQSGNVSIITDSKNIFFEETLFLKSRKFADEI